MKCKLLKLDQSEGTTMYTGLTVCSKASRLRQVFFFLCNAKCTHMKVTYKAGNVIYF